MSYFVFRLRYLLRFLLLALYPLSPSLPQYVALKKEESERRVFQGTSSSSSYFFTEFFHGKAVCLVCSQHVAVLNEYNLCCHYVSLHPDKYDNFQGQQGKRKGGQTVVAAEETTVCFYSEPRHQWRYGESQLPLCQWNRSGFKTIYWGWIHKSMHGESSGHHVPWKATSFCKYQSDKKEHRRQDFQSFSGFGQLEQSKGFYCLFSCN